MNLLAASRLFVAILFLQLLLPALMARRPPALPMQLTLDPTRTQVRFMLSDVLHTIHGTFVVKSGTVRFDPASGVARGVIVIDAASGGSGNQTRDSRMRKKILEVDRYPEVVFLPRRIIGMVPARGPGRFIVQGVCRIHGGEHPLTLPFTATVTGARFSGTTQVVIPYVEWGIKDPSTLFLRVSKQVTIDVTAVGQLQPAPK